MQPRYRYHRFRPSCAQSGKDSGLSKHLPCFCSPARDFEVDITARSLPAEGNPLELICLVVGRGGDQKLQGTWFLNGKEIAQIDADGVLDLKTDYRDRASQGQLQVSKLSTQTFSLKIFSLSPEDVGAYSCEVAEVVRTQTGSWQVVRRKQSPVSRVQLREPAGMWHGDNHRWCSLQTPPPWAVQEHSEGFPIESGVCQTPLEVE